MVLGAAAVAVATSARVNVPLVDSLFTHVSKMEEASPSSLYRFCGAAGPCVEDVSHAVSLVL